MKRSKNPPPRLRRGDKDNPRQILPKDPLEYRRWFRDKDNFGWRDESYPTEKYVLGPLYHATTALSKIATEGFKPRSKAGRAGLGGGTSEAVSFTQDRKLALEIARCLREMILICQGRIGWNEVIHWAKRDGVYKGAAKFWAEINWSTQFDPEELVGMAANGIELIQSWKLSKEHPGKGYAPSVAEVKQLGYELHPQANIWQGRDEAFTNGPFLRNSTPEEALWNIFDFYRKYLYAAHAKKKRVDPLFFNVTPDNFTRLDPDDVGVVAAAIVNPNFVPRPDELEFRKGNIPTGAFSYEWGMDEYRVYDVKQLKVLRAIECKYER